MSERMSDERLADIEAGFGLDEEAIIAELTAAIKAERRRVEGLEEEQVCLKTNIPAAHRLLTQRRTIKRLLERAEAAEAKLDAVRRLNQYSWSVHGMVTPYYDPRYVCADELEALLEQTK